MMNYNWTNYFKFAVDIYRLSRDRDSKSFSSFLEENKFDLDPDTMYRNVMSRAYYSIYRPVLNLVIEQDDCKLESGTHTELVHYLLNHADEKKHLLGDSMRKLLRSRQFADYSNNTVDHRKKNISNAARAGTALAQATKINQILEDLQK